ncbi:MAG: DNA polymerase I, partial [Candidatus Marinimicrobia bacterium]|nr:DNA polymerase I [Candidatus Neomarinimicrobiota bacterium]
NAFIAKLVGLSFAWKEGEAWYIPLKFSGKEQELFAESDLDFIISELKPILENPEIGKNGQNIKYDAEVLIKYDIRLQGIRFDTMIAEYILNSGNGSYKLDNLALHYLHYRMQPIEELIGIGKKQISMDKVPLEQAGWYACEDADVTLQLTNIMEDKLKKEGLDKLYKEIELALIDCLIRMESNGMHLDLVFLKEMSIDLEQSLIKEIQKIYDTAGEAFNINSPAQLSHLLFTKFGLKPIKKTKTGYSTDVKVLEALQSEHPLPAQILEYRGLTKLKNTYVDALPKLKNPLTGRIHSSFNQTGTSTGRLSSSNPNFQNIPIRTERGRKIRKAFVPEKENWQLLAADYSQVELRIIAHLSKDKTLIEAFNNDLDIHRKTASLVYSVTEDDVTPDMRRTAKVINFGIIYGAGPFRIAQELNISRGEAAGIIKAYFESYPGLKNYIDATTSFAEEHGYVETLFGRRREIRDINSDNHNLREASKRALINMPVQGSAADLIKIAMIRLNHKFTVL